jgi:hypothetical protein
METLNFQFSITIQNREGAEHLIKLLLSNVLGNFSTCWKKTGSIPVSDTMSLVNFFMYNAFGVLLCLHFLYKKN